MDNGVDAGQKKQVTVKDAHRFLNDVKVAFQNETEKYDELMKILKDFKASKINTIDVISKVKELFKGHTYLIVGFNNFLPEGYEIDDDVDALNNAIAFLKTVKVAFQNETEKYYEFLEILKDFKDGRTDSIGATKSRLRELCKEHIDLILGINNFLPNGYEFIITNELIVQLISRM